MDIQYYFDIIIQYRAKETVKTTNKNYINMNAKTVNIESLDLSFMCEDHRLQYIANCKRINEAIVSGYNMECIASLQWTNSLIINCYN